MRSCDSGTDVRKLSTSWRFDCVVHVLADHARCACDRKIDGLQTQIGDRTITLGDPISRRARSSRLAGLAMRLLDHLPAHLLAALPALPR